MTRINRVEIERREYIAALEGKTDLTLAEQIGALDRVKTTKLSGKLLDFYSLTTSPTKNEFCQCRMKNEKMVCHKCFSDASFGYKPELKQKLEFNSDVLSTWLFSCEAWATYRFENVNGYARLESHGDVRNVIQARNYIRLVNTHKHINFTVWSKNLMIWHKAFKLEGGKPDNMKFIASSPFLNVVMPVQERFRYFVDHVFTVYTLEYAMKHHIKINCGGRSCRTCLKCYKKDCEIYYINELEKGDAKKAGKADFDIGA